MKIHPEVTHLGGVVAVILTATFVGDATDVDDRDRILAYGDPRVNLGGSFSDGQPVIPLTFQTGCPEVWVGLTTAMHTRPVRFMATLPVAAPGAPAPTQGYLDVITPDPVHAATVYVQAIQARCAQVMTDLRQKTPTKLLSLPDTTV